MWLVKHPLWTALLLSPLALISLVIIYYSGWAAAFDLDRVSHMPATTIIYDREGYVIQRLFEENRMLVDSSQIPEHLKKALIAKEDERFYYHPGFDPFSILRALVGNFTSGKVESGASTITQQLARNSAGMFDRSLDRKLKELFLAIRIEMVFSKDEILTFYFNRIYFGGNVYGIGAAAEEYFGKSPKDLTLSESAMLIGIVAGPNIYSPWKNVDLAKEVRAKTLERMVECGYLTEDEAAACNKEAIVLRARIDKPGSYVASTVQDMLPDFLTHEHIYRGGLRIHTTIDLAFQRAAESTLEDSLSRIEATQGYRNQTRAAYLKEKGTASPRYLQGAFVALSNVDGGILAIVGGRNFDESPYNRAMKGRRQIGSTAKAYVYTHAFNVLNCTAFTEVDHSAFDLKKFNPEIIPTGPNPEFISIREALQRSDNYAAVRTGLVAGIEGYAHLFSEASGAPITPTPSTLLGSCELTPLELASAYSTLANYGVRIEPHLIDHVTTHDGKVLYQHIDTRKRVVSPQIAFQVCNLLQGVVDQGTARSLRNSYAIKGDVCGKTGTTNDYKDSWFAGFTTEITATVWVGLDRPAQIMPGGYASRIAVPIWGRVMKLANEHYKPGTFLPPPGVEKVQNRKEEKVFFFFKKSTVNGPTEYVRDDQRGNALLRIDETNLEALARSQQKKSWARQTWDSFWGTNEKDMFQNTGEEGPRAVIQDNPESKIPQATPVNP